MSAVPSALVFSLYLCHVRCQWVSFINNSNSINNFTVGKLTTSDSGWSPLDEGHHQASDKFFSSSQNSLILDHSQTKQLSIIQSNRIRRQVQVYFNKNNVGLYSWKYRFEIIPDTFTSTESLRISIENRKLLENMLNNDIKFEFLDPEGLRTSLPDKTNIRIVDFRFKLNEDFISSNDIGHYIPSSYKIGNRLMYNIPVTVEQANKIFYFMKARVNNEATDITIKGVLEIIPSNLGVGPNTITQPQPPYGTDSTPSLGGGLGGEVRGISWSHRFNINATYGILSQGTINNWQREAQLLKTSLERITFDFTNPSGLTILVPDSMSTKIEDFRLKLNEEFRGNDGGHFGPLGTKRGNMLAYYVAGLNPKPGDKVYYFMRIKLGKEGFDTIVRGVIPFSGSDNSFQSQSPTVDSGPVQLEGAAWNHKFEITNTLNSPEAAHQWRNEIKYFKDALENDLKFHFFNPTGLGISISGENENVKILAFNIKINEEFRGFEPGNFLPEVSQLRDGRWNYYYRNLKLKKGDKLYFWIRATFGKQSLDSRVKGVMEITKGDPHLRGSFPDYPPPQFPIRPSPAPIDQPTPPGTRFPPASPPGTRYPPASPPGTRNPPASPPGTRYPPASPPGTRNPPSSPPGTRYPPASPPSTQYPPSSPPGTQYPPITPPVTVYPPSGTRYPPPSLPDTRYPPEGQPPNDCQSKTSATTYGVPTHPCPGQILLDHHFTTIEGWTHHIAIGGKNKEDEFTTFTRYEENISIKQNRLYIKPTLLEERTNDSFVRRGILTLTGCTILEPGTNYCQRRASGATILPPVESARIQSQRLLTFRYGTVEIKAKFPRGDWIVPELWLVPTNPDAKEKVVIGMARGNNGVTSFQLSAGVVRDIDDRLTLMNMKGNAPWFQSYHTFKLEWTTDHVKFFVDNRQFHFLPTISSTVFSQEVFISLGVHVGGYRDFPNDLFPNKPWSDSSTKRMALFWEAKQDWHPSWKNSPALQVESVKVTAL